MALAQLNLKLPPEVLAQWRAQAAAEGLSVRDWLIARLSPAAGAAGPDLADRVEALEARLAALEQRPARAPRPAPAAPPAAPLPPPADLPADGIETAALADLLGLKRGTFNAKVIRNGGPRPGLVLEGWRCLGMQPSKRGGPPRARWLPAGPD